MLSIFVHDKILADPRLRLIPCIRMPLNIHKLNTIQSLPYYLEACYRARDRPSICAFGTAFCILNHSPLNALTSHELSSAKPISTKFFEEVGLLTVINNLIRIVEVNAVIRVREEMHIIILDPLQIQLIEQRRSILHVHIVIRNAVHDQEAHVLRQGFDVVDAGVLVAAWVILWRVHVALGVDGIWQRK